MSDGIHRDLARNTLAILCVLGLIGLTLWILRPFLAAAVWAATLVVATWPLLLGLERRLGGRRPAAVVILTLALLLLLILPLWLVVAAVFDHSGELTVLAREWHAQFGAAGLPALPDWLVGLPWGGERLAAWWNELRADGGQGLAQKLAPHLLAAGRWLLAGAGGLGGLALHALLVVALAAAMYAFGEAAAQLVRRIGRRLGGARGEAAVVLAAQAVRGVALGVGVTALVQSLLGGLGLVLAGIPFAGLLSALMLLLCIAQLGPALVLFPAVAWLYWLGDSTWASGLLLWSIGVVTLDNFLRPALIRLGADLPLLLIFAGVLGGMLAFGLIGLFVGPVVLAVTWTLLQAWLDDAGAAV